MAFVATLKNPRPKPLSMMLVALPPPLVGIRVVFDHCVAFVVIDIVANVEVPLMPLPLLPQSLLLCRAPGGDK
jgi:hypothetical protein